MLLFTDVYTFFIGRPDKMFLISIVFLAAYGILYYWKRKQDRIWPMPTLCLLWFCYGLWEAYCTAIKANIRVDFMFSVPMIITATFYLIIVQVILVWPKNKN